MSNADKSIQEVAEMLNEPTQRCRYLVSKYHIPHCRLVGNCRMYDTTAQELIKEYLFNIRVQS